jgi:hypothetical protein
MSRSFRLRTPRPGQVSDHVETYATLDPYLYTPTEEKPYRGIWVGDFIGHGCEFLLLHQPQDDKPFRVEDVIRQHGETEPEYLARREELRTCHGKVYMIKLTGDPHVWRGQHTFVADDIGEEGFVRHATDSNFPGARIVRSKGHIADVMMRDGELKMRFVIVNRRSEMLTAKKNRTSKASSS